MNTREIEKLIEKYEEGLTSLHEEQLLKEFFRGTDIPENLRSYAELFTYFDQSKSETISDPGFNHKMDDLLSHSHPRPHSTRHASRVTRHVPSVTHHASRVTYFSIAASILLIIGLFFTLRQDIFRKNGAVKTTAEQEVAMEQVQKALFTVSSNLNIGLDQLRRLESFGNAVGEMQKLSKFYQYQPIIINPDNPQ